jgi:nucleotide-binding universal stress UspA family protein
MGIASAQRTAPEDAVFHHLLVCLDRSEAAERALPLAAFLARMGDARVTVLHVLETRGENREERVTDALGWEIARQEAVSYLEGVGERLGLPMRTVVAEGGPSAHRIAGLTEELSADLTVLTTHGEGGMGEWSLGSTAQKILALSRGSILITPTNPRSPAPRVPPQRILVPLDGSKRTEFVLPTATRLARGSGAEVILAHVVDEPMVSEVLSSAADLSLARKLAERQSENARDYLERIRSRLVADGVAARVLVRRDRDHREGLVSLAHSESTDLVVLCAHGSVCNAERQFGSVASYMIAHSSTPLLVIQDLPDRARRTSSIPPPRTQAPPRSLDAHGRG